MNNQALWQAVAALLVVAADLVIEKSVNWEERNRKNERVSDYPHGNARGDSSCDVDHS